MRKNYILLLLTACFVVLITLPKSNNLIMICGAVILYSSMILEICSSTYEHIMKNIFASEKIKDARGKFLIEVFFPLLFLFELGLYFLLIIFDKNNFQAQGGLLTSLGFIVYVLANNHLQTLLFVNNYGIIYRGKVISINNIESVNSFFSNCLSKEICTINIVTYSAQQYNIKLDKKSAEFFLMRLKELLNEKNLKEQMDSKTIENV